MDSKRALAHRDVLRDYCKAKHWTSPHAVTLTLKTRTLVGSVWQTLTQLDAQQNLRHWLNVIRKKLVKRGFTKHAELQRVPIYEGGRTQGIRPHYHLVLDKPDCIQTPEYETLIQSEWARTRWGHHRVTVEACYDAAGSLDYITKLRTKEHYPDSIDWTNFK
jgi:hypothetical protein